jgi:hypothetical protein
MLNSFNLCNLRDLWMFDLFSALSACSEDTFISGIFPLVAFSAVAFHPDRKTSSAARIPLSTAP